MLRLDRTIGQAINIGDDINLTIISIKGNQVTLGFNAPKEVEIHREEVYFKIQREKAKKLNEDLLFNSESTYKKQAIIKH